MTGTVFPRHTTCTPCGISSPPICWNTVPASRWRPTCWGTQIPPFWNEPTAIRRISAKRRLPGCLILCWHRQRKNTVPPWMNEIPMLLFVRHTHSEGFPFWEDPHYWLCSQTLGVLPGLHKYRGRSSLGLVMALYRRGWYPLCQYTAEWSKWQASENEDKTVISS